MKKLSILPQLILLMSMSSVTYAQGPDAAAAQGGDVSLSFDIEVLDFNTDLGPEISRLVLDKARLDRMIAERRIRQVASLQVRAKSGESAAIQVGQRVPVLGPQTPQGTRQTQLDNTSLTVNISPVFFDNRIQVSLRVEFSGVTRSEGTGEPGSIQRTFSNKVRLKPNERAVLLGVVQQSGLWPAPTDISHGNLVIILTGRVID